MATGPELKALRQAAGATQSEVAKAAGWHHSAPHQIEEAERPHPPTISRYLVALGTVAARKAEAMQVRATEVKKAAAAGVVSANLYGSLVALAQSEKKPSETLQAAVARVSRSGPGAKLAAAYSATRRTSAPLTISEARRLVIPEDQFAVRYDRPTPPNVNGTTTESVVAPKKKPYVRPGDPGRAAGFSRAR